MTKNVNGFNKRNNRGAICKMFPYYSPPAMMMLPIVVWGSFVANDKNLSVTSRKRKREAGEVSSSVQGGDPEPQIQLTFENPVQLPSALIDLLHWTLTQSQLMKTLWLKASSNEPANSSCLIFFLLHHLSLEGGDDIF